MVFSWSLSLEGRRLQALGSWPAQKPTVQSLKPQYISNRKPALLSVHPLRRLQRALRERRTITIRMRHRNRFERAVEANSVRARHRSGAARRDVYRMPIAGVLHALLQVDRRSRRGIFLRRVMDLVNPRAVLRIVREHLR